MHISARDILFFCFIVEGKEDKVYKLSKTIYGLKDIPKIWYNRIDDYLISLGFDK